MNKKDFQLHFVGGHDDLEMIVVLAKEFAEKLKEAGAELEIQVFQSGHLKGGSRELQVIHSENPAELADGSQIPAKTESPIIEGDNANS